MKLKVWVLAMVLVLLTVGCSSKAGNDRNNSVNNYKENLKTEEKIKTEEEKGDEKTASINEEDAYILENSDFEKLTLDRIIQMEDKDLPYVRNEIFARKGYVFETSQYIVEHDPDPEVIQVADYIVDVGPRAGTNGGRIVFEGSYTNLLKAKTLTGEYMGRSLPIKSKPLKELASTKSFAFAVNYTSFYASV